MAPFFKSLYAINAIKNMETFILPARQSKLIMSKTFPPRSEPPRSAFTLFNQLLRQEPGQCWLSLGPRKILWPFISSRGAQIVFKTINTIAGSETGGPIYPVAALNAEDKTNDNTVCLLWPSPQALIGGLVPMVRGGTHVGYASLRTAVSISLLTAKVILPTLSLLN